MNRKVPAHADARPDAWLAWVDTLADETRLRLLHSLEHHELGVAELCDVLQLPQSTVSSHLKVLSDQGWVASRRLATTHLYRTILDELDPAARQLWLLARAQTERWATLRQDALRLERVLRERETSGEAFFAGAAGEWDALRTDLYGDDFTTAALLSLLPGELTVADLGCGSGAVSEMLAPHVRRVIGVDTSAAMLKAARKRLGSFSNVELRKGDVLELPLVDASCDAALLLLVLAYVPDVRAALAEASRVVRPSGGRVIVVDLLPHDREDFRRQHGQVHAGFEPGLFREWCGAAGLKRVSIRALPPAPTAGGPALFMATAER